MKIVVFGPGPKFKGGIANYTLSLAKALDKFEDVKVHIMSWTNQYPSIIPRDFIDRSSKVDLLEGTKIEVSYLTNYNNPFSWEETANEIAKINPDKVIFQWAISVQGLPMGYIAQRLKSKTKAEIIFDLHVVTQKEGSGIDKTFMKYALSKPHSFIVHALKTYNELKEIFPDTKYFLDDSGKRAVSKDEKSVIKLFHPIYDMFKPDPNFDVDAVKKELNLNKNVFLFFGFIRKYKGLHNVIMSFAELAKKRDDVSLLVVGESFWNTLDSNKLSTKIKKALFGFVKKMLVKKADDEAGYRPLELIEELGIQNKVTVVNKYVPNEDVHKYFQVSNANVLYYLTATPSGVESISYNFNMPILATKVGHFTETIKDGFNGYLAEPENIQSMAEVMEKHINNPIPHENVAKSAEFMSWENYAKAILRG